MLIDIELPATVESPIDENGIKTITSYKWGPNQELVKVTRKVQMEKVETPVLKRVLERVKDERRNSKRVDSHQAFRPSCWWKRGSYKPWWRGGIL